MSPGSKNLRSPKTKKPTQEKQNSELEDILTKLASLSNKDLSTIADSIKKVAESQIKKNEAVTKLVTTIFDFLFIPDNNTIQPKTHAGETEPTLSYATGVRYTRDEVLSLIGTMREERATYKIIADYLQEKNIPTFSGRGEWHAQTIHRLCKHHNIAPKFSNTKKGFQS